MSAIASFSYAELPIDVQTRLRETALAIRTSSQRQIEEIAATGKALGLAKAELPHGLFGVWLATEFGWKASLIVRHPLTTDFERQRIGDMANRIRIGMAFHPHWRTKRLFDELVAMLSAKGVRP